MKHLEMNPIFSKTLRRKNLATWAKFRFIALLLALLKHISQAYHFICCLAIKGKTQKKEIIHQTEHHI